MERIFNKENKIFQSSCLMLQWDLITIFRKIWSLILKAKLTTYRDVVDGIRIFLYFGPDVKLIARWHKQVKIQIHCWATIAQAMAQWIRLCLPSCGPGFKSQAHHLFFFYL